mgnify:CR=1 FL=1
MKKYNNAEFNINNVGCDVTLFGWVSKKRNLGGLLFIDLRDRSGIIQLIVKPDKEFYDIVINLAKRNNINMTEEELHSEANKWEISHGGISGRTAQQFINHCLSMQEK